MRDAIIHHRSNHFGQAKDLFSQVKTFLFIYSLIALPLNVKVKAKATEANNRVRDEDFDAVVACFHLRFAASAML